MPMMILKDQRSRLKDLEASISDVAELKLLLCGILAVANTEMEKHERAFAEAVSLFCFVLLVWATVEHPRILISGYFKLMKTFQ